MRFKLESYKETKLLLEYGADPNYPYPNASPLSSKDLTKDTYILLLQYGADPMKLVDGKPAFLPVLKQNDASTYIFYQFYSFSSFSLLIRRILSNICILDCSAIMSRLLKKGIDVNCSDGKHTLLEVTN